KSAASKAAILDALRDHRYFSAIPTKELLRMAKTTLEVRTYAGANILTQGEHGDEFYVLESGAAEILVDDVKVGAYGAGATFGELALLYRAPRAATIRALEDCRCWVVDSKTFRKVVIDARRAQESSRADFLRKLPLFADFDFVFLSRLANSLETCRFQRGEAIIRQGDVGESMFIIEAGAVKVEQSAGFRTRHLVTLRPGDYFGEMALLHNLPRAATCIAECEEDEVVKCVSMRRSHFESLFGNLKDMMERQVKRRILKSLVIFEAVSDAAIDVAAEKMRVAEYARGDSILKIASLLGQGGFGRVLLVEHKHPHKLMALKAMSKKAVTDAKQEKTLLAERDCIEKFDHAFVVGFYGAFQDRDFVYLAIEYAAGGDLYSFMYEREEQSRRFRGPLGGLDARTSRFYLGCIALGLEHLHGHHVAWRDLKPENILFDPRGYVKLSDFGFAKEFDARTFTLCGTPDYLAPEIVLSQGHDKAVDFWALGVLAYELCYARTPFAHDSQGELFQNILQASTLVHEDDTWPGPCPADVRSLVTELLHTQPSFRLGNGANGFASIKRHAFFH
ncbi:hypothetical protein AURANDRAFT_687, partial [Aureococcus anophagefferens]